MTNVQTMMRFTHRGRSIQGAGVVRTRVAVALIVILLIGGGAFLMFSTYLTGDDYVKDFFLQQLEQSYRAEN